MESSDEMRTLNFSTNFRRSHDEVWMMVIPPLMATALHNFRWPWEVLRLRRDYRGHQCIRCSIRF